MNAQLQASAAPTTGGTLIVGCKLPNGLHLDLKTKGGERQRVTLNGANSGHIVGGYGLTRNVSAEFIMEWLKVNAKHPAVVNNEIFVHNQLESAEDMARERRDIETGLEPIDPVKKGMLRNAEGSSDPQAVKDYEKAKGENPTRSRQLVE